MMHKDLAVSPAERDFLQAAYDAANGTSPTDIFEIGRRVFPDEEHIRERSLRTFLTFKARGWLLGPLDGAWITREGKKIIGKDDSHAFG